MLIRNKKNKLNTALLAGSILLSAQAVKPAANAASTITQKIQDNNVVAHAAEEINAGVVGVDVASYQDTDLTKYKNAGAQFAIVKLTEGTSYVNPKAADQYASAQANDLMTMGYFFATFGTDTQKALNEARFFVQHAQAMGIPRGSYLAVDYESGDGNNFSITDRTANTNAILNAMNYIRLSGYQPLIYTGQNFMDNYIDEARLSEHYPNSEWIAAYTQGYKPSSEAIFDWKPPYQNLVMWQFTPNFNGEKTDASVAIQNMKNKPDMPAYIDSEGKPLGGYSVNFLPNGNFTMLAPPVNIHDGSVGSGNPGTDTGNTDTGSAGNVDTGNSGTDVGGTDTGNPSGDIGDLGTDADNVDVGGSGTDTDNQGTDVGGTDTNAGNQGTDNGSSNNDGTVNLGNNTGSSNTGSNVDLGNNAGSSSNDNIGVSDAGNSNNNTGNAGNGSSGAGNSDNATENEHEGHGWNGSMSSVAFKKGFNHSDGNDGRGMNGSMSSVAFKKGFSQSENNVGNTGSNIDNSNKNNNNVIDLLPDNNDKNIINNQPLPSDKKEQEVKNEKIAQANNEQKQQENQNQQNQQQSQNLSNDLGNSSSSTSSDLAQTSTNEDKQNIWVELFGLSAASLGLMKLQKKDDAK